MSEIICPLFGLKTKSPIKSAVLEDGYEISVADTIENVVCWDSIAKNNIYLSSKFLNFVVENPPSDISSRFVSVYKNNQLVGILYFQIKDLNLGKAMRIDREKSGLFEFMKKVRHSLYGLINHKVLICGNTLVTGDNAFRFIEKLTENESNALVNNCIDFVIEDEKRRGHNIRSILVKDFYKNNIKSKIQFHHDLYTPLEVQPNMIFELNPNWTSFEDYLAAMKAKSRTRLKRALKKSENLSFRTLSTDEIEEYNDEIYSLYKSTSDNASFNLFLLDRNYFLNFAKKFPNRFQLHAVFKADKLIAFYTTIEEEDVLDAHFLGYNRNENQQHQLYLNILLKLVQKTIYLGKAQLCLSRTAMEIKSSIGAQGHDMNVYLKSRNKLINASLKKILETVAPKEKWVPRSPFKKAN